MNHNKDFIGSFLCDQQGDVEELWNCRYLGFITENNLLDNCIAKGPVFLGGLPIPFTATPSSPITFHRLKNHRDWIMFYVKKPMRMKTTSEGNQFPIRPAIVQQQDLRSNK